MSGLDQPNPALNVTMAGFPSPARYTSGGPRPAPSTINRLFFEAVEKYDSDDALLFKQSGRWEPIAHSVLLTRVRRTWLGLSKLGVVAGERVAILSENRPEWTIVDYACICSGITDVPIYATLPAAQLPYVMNDSGAKIVFVSTREQAQKIASVRGEMPGLTHVIGFDAGQADGCDMTLGELEATGAEMDSDAVAARFRSDALAVPPDALLTLIYTSGTTGAPKGVMLTQDNVASNCAASEELIPLGDDDTALSFLPLSHIFERMGAYYLFSRGVTIAFAESIDAVAANMVEVRPSIMLSVPRLYEKIFARVLDSAISSGGLKKSIFFWARAVGERWADERLAGRQPGLALATRYKLASKLVFSKLRERTGGNIRVFVSGGAPLSPEIAKFFYAAGLTILEGYGLTETSPVISANTIKNYKLGTVGRPIRGVEIMIANDGEILTRGPHVMRGYYNNPEATAEAIDSADWLHTGDVGELVDGYLRITDRKKDIIVTAGGKNIAPQPIEILVKKSKYVSQAVMIGDRRKFPAILVVPEWDQLEKWASRQKISWSNRAELLAMTKIAAKMEKEVLSPLSNLAHFELPKKVALIEHDFSIERGELTPKLSVKRRVIEASYKNLIDSLYAEHG